MTTLGPCAPDEARYLVSFLSAVTSSFVLAAALEDLRIGSAL
jgi:hypothetical protein